MKEKAAGQVDFGGLGVTRSEPYMMEVESDRLVIGYTIRMEGEFTAASLGWFSILTMYMQICIDVINSYLKIPKGAKLSLKFDDHKNVKEYEIQNFRGHEVIYGDFFEARDTLRFFWFMTICLILY